MSGNAVRLPRQCVGEDKLCRHKWSGVIFLKYGCVFRCFVPLCVCVYCIYASVYEVFDGQRKMPSAEMNRKTIYQMLFYQMTHLFTLMRSHCFTTMQSSSFSPLPPSPQISISHPPPPPPDFPLYKTHDNSVPGSR